MHLIIYSPILTPRVKYIFNFIFKDILKVETEFTTVPSYFLASEHVKISYAEKPLGKELFFRSSSLLYSQKVGEMNLKSIKFGDYNVPFEVRNSALPFDVFAASFFILTRYEEYLHKEHSKEEFTAKDSRQHKWKILDKPIIDEWALMIKNMIVKKHLEFKFPKKTFFHQETINFSLKPDTPKGFLPRSKFLLRSVINNSQTFFNNIFDESVGLGMDRSVIISNLDLKTKSSDTLYFVGFPKDLENEDDFSSSVGLLNNKDVGLLTPCTPEFEQVDTLKISIAKFNKIHNQKNIPISQQLDGLKIPSCYLHLLSKGINSDYSMGYSTELGFRAGTCTPFNWYDLQLEKATSLNVKSYCINDKVLQKLRTEESTAIIKDYIIAVELVNGHFYSSWQLKSLSENVNFKKTRNAFDFVLKYTAQ